MAGLSDVGSTPTVSTRKPDVKRIRFFYGANVGYDKTGQFESFSSME
jgi:hypothetical protein